jgi:hypothetical protein
MMAWEIFELVKQEPRAFQIQGDQDDITTLKWVYILPKNMPAGLKSQWLQEMYGTYHRLMFLTGRKVWFRNKVTKEEQRILLVPSPHLLSKCDRMFLKKKGFPVKANGCNRDSCRQCRDGSWL